MDSVFNSAMDGVFDSVAPVGPKKIRTLLQAEGDIR